MKSITQIATECTSELLDKCSMKGGEFIARIEAAINEAINTRPSPASSGETPEEFAGPNIPVSVYIQINNGDAFLAGDNCGLFGELFGDAENGSVKVRADALIARYNAAPALLAERNALRREVEALKRERAAYFASVTEVGSLVVGKANEGGKQAGRTMVIADDLQAEAEAMREALRELLGFFAPKGQQVTPFGEAAKAYVLARKEAIAKARALAAKGGSKL